MGKKANKPDLKKIQTDIAAYFEGNTRFSIPGLCLALDICKETLSEWEQGLYTPEDTQRNKELSEAIKKAKLRIEQYLLENDSKTSTKDMAVLNSFYGYKQPADGGFPADAAMDLGRIEEWSD